MATCRWTWPPATGRSSPPGSAPRCTDATSTTSRPPCWAASRCSARRPGAARRPTTLAALRDGGHRRRTVKQEVRANLIARLAAGEPRFPGIVGFDDTVLPEVERALLAGHDMVLLGERGQGKTRLIRSLVHLLDEWTPVVAGCEINDHPEAPACG